MPTYHSASGSVAEDLGVMIMGAHNDRAIKNVLNHLFRRHRLGKWNSYDTTTAITYLIQSEFRHIDLIKALETESPPLHRYYHFNCSGSFMRQHKSKKYESSLTLPKCPSVDLITQ